MNESQLANEDHSNFDHSTMILDDNIIQARPNAGKTNLIKNQYQYESNKALILENRTKIEN